MKYLPALDGLRAIAIMSVMLYHANFPYAIYGWRGVDVFFVLSGYLITSLLLTEHQKTGRINLRAFYVRRALRLLPALCVMLAVTSWYFHSLGFNSALPVFSSLFYFSNILWIAYGWDPLAPFGITWTLSVEEQFYLIWPPVFLFLLRRRVSLKIICLGLIFICVTMWSLRFAQFNQLYDSAYGRFLWTRPDEILAGCALALIFRKPFKFPLLELKPLVWTGKISYSLYLWHVLAFAIAGSYSLRPWPSLFSQIGLAFILAAASYYFIEHPFLKLKSRLTTATQAELPEAQTRDRRQWRKSQRLTD